MRTLDTVESEMKNNILLRYVSNDVMFIDFVVFLSSSNLIYYRAWSCSTILIGFIMLYYAEIMT